MNKTLILLIFISSLNLAKAQNAKFNKALADSLFNLIETDQIVSGPAGNKSRYAEMNKQERAAYKDSVLTNHKIIVEKIFDQYGFPGFDLVGRTGSKHFWLVVQHCDKFPDFQARVLPAMKKQVDRNNAIATDYAYLTDRVLINTGHKQLFATQVNYNFDIGLIYPKPVADSLKLDERRKQVGLEPIREYLNEMMERNFAENESFYKSKGVIKPKLYDVTK